MSIAAYLQHAGRAMGADRDKSVHTSGEEQFFQVAAVEQSTPNR